MEIEKADGQDKKPVERGRELIEEEKERKGRRQVLDVFRDIADGIDPDAILRLLLNF